MDQIDHTAVADYNRAKREAENVLNAHSINSPPVPIMEIARNYVSDISFVVFTPPHDNTSGLFDFNDNRILINAEDPGNRQRFTIAHELGHLIMHPREMDADGNMGILLRKPIKNEENSLEKEANCFAASLLVPAKILNEYKHFPKATIARLFAVSQEVIGFRLEALAKFGGQL